MRKTILIMLIFLCVLFTSGCGIETTSSNISRIPINESTTTLSNADNSSKKQVATTTSKKQTSTSSKKIEVQIPTSKESSSEATTTTSTYNELTDSQLFNQRFNELFTSLTNAMQEDIYRLESTINSYSTYIAQNTTINQTAYMIYKRQTDERYANMGLTNSGQHLAAIKALEQQYLVEHNPTVIKYKNELPELREELIQTKDLLEDEEGKIEYCISYLCKEYGYDEVTAHQMLYYPQ